MTALRLALLDVPQVVVAADDLAGVRDGGGDVGDVSLEPGQPARPGQGFLVQGAGVALAESADGCRRLRYLRGVRYPDSDRLDAAHQQLAGPLEVAWHNPNTHLSRTMTELIAARDCLTVFQLPTYAHELNPVELVWSHRKTSVANLAKRNIAQLTVLVKTSSSGCSTGPACWRVPGRHTPGPHTFCSRTLRIFSGVSR